ncbi:MAG: Gfo/Idh/MocA family oxidoreductase [Lachnospiraceae bacterium]|nr:Gfo/Idh/MocA family oxidoreductase [Lachnospiraceae bacterium]
MTRTDENKQIKIGIIGAGAIIPQSIHAMREEGSLIPVGICSRPESFVRVQELADQLAIPQAYPDVKSLLSGSDVETVYIAVSNAAHYEVAKQALLAGKHVLMEKPFCANREQSAQLFALAKKKKLFCMEAAPVRFAPVIRQVKEWLPQIGRIRMVQTNYSQYSSRYDRFLAGECPAVFDPAKAGGSMMDLGIYQVHFLLTLFGMPDSWHYSANTVRGIDTSGVLEMRYPDFICSSVTTKDCDGISGFQIQGEAGFITSDCRLNDITRATLHLRNGQDETFDEARVGHRFIHEMNEFARIVLEKDHGACQVLAQGTLDSLSILDQARMQADIVIV